ncbi:MAG: hypothetical protein AB7G06_04755 [Bdellovibrionales bacterium]
MIEHFQFFMPKYVEPHLFAGSDTVDIQSVNQYCKNESERVRLELSMAIQQLFESHGSPYFEKMMEQLAITKASLDTFTPLAYGSELALAEGRAGPVTRGGIELPRCLAAGRLIAHCIAHLHIARVNAEGHERLDNAELTEQSVQEHLIHKQTAPAVSDSLEGVEESLDQYQSVFGAVSYDAVKATILVFYKPASMEQLDRLEQVFKLATPNNGTEVSRRYDQRDPGGPG